MRLVEFGCGPWAALGNKPRNEPTEFGEALTRKRQAPRKCLRQKPLNRGVTSQAASHHAWFRSNVMADLSDRFPDTGPTPSGRKSSSWGQGTSELAEVESQDRIG